MESTLNGSLIFGELLFSLNCGLGRISLLVLG